MYCNIYLSNLYRPIECSFQRFQMWRIVKVRIWEFMSFLGACMFRPTRPFLSQSLNVGPCCRGRCGGFEGGKWAKADQDRGGNYVRQPGVSPRFRDGERDMELLLGYLCWICLLWILCLEKHMENMLMIRCMNGGSPEMLLDHDSEQHQI